MLVRIPSFVAIALTVAPLFVVTGCSSEPAPPASSGTNAAGTSGAGADPHDVPLTEDEIKQIKSENARFADALTTISSLRDTIRDAIAALISAA